MHENHVNLGTRRGLAQCLRQLLSGHLSYAEYSKQSRKHLSIDPEDLAAVDIHEAIDDVFEPPFSFARHTHRGPWLDAETKRAIARAVLFLYTDTPYERPKDQSTIGGKLFVGCYLSAVVVTIGLLGAVNPVGFACFFVSLVIAAVILARTIWIAARESISRLTPRVTPSVSPPSTNLWPFPDDRSFTAAKQARVFLHG